MRPLLKIDLMMSDRYENLIAEGADLALRVGEQPDSSFVARKLESARRVFVAAPSYLGRRGAPKSLADLAGTISSAAVRPCRASRVGPRAATA